SSNLFQACYLNTLSSTSTYGAESTSLRTLCTNRFKKRLKARKNCTTYFRLFVVISNISIMNAAANTTYNAYVTIVSSNLATMPDSLSSKGSSGFCPASDDGSSITSPSGLDWMPENH